MYVKKIIVLLLVILLSVTILTGCNTTFVKEDEIIVKEDEIVVKEEEGLTKTGAWDLVQQWLDEHPDMITPYEPTKIAGMDDEMYFYNSEQYYFFELSGYYWLDILVHSETGELLCIITEESDEPVEPVIEPLMDYYNRFY